MSGKRCIPFLDCGNCCHCSRLPEKNTSEQDLDLFFLSIVQQIWHGEMLARGKPKPNQFSLERNQQGHKTSCNSVAGPGRLTAETVTMKASDQKCLG